MAFFIHREVNMWRFCILLSVMTNMVLLQRVHGFKPTIEDPTTSKVPCLFVFGASLFDVGNNNAIKTLAKANYPPYGIDFRQGPTGRFTNGKNMADVIASYLGYKYSPPPFATATDDDVMIGINYAASGSGIRNETGEASGEAIGMEEQIDNHGKTVDKISSKMGNKEQASEHLSKCVYTINAGTNDLINNYFNTKLYNTSKQFTIEQYVEALIDQFSEQLTRLHSYGARKVALLGLARLGCLPYILGQFDHKGSPCVDKVNDAVQLFNDKVKTLARELNSQLPGAKFTYLNAFGILSQDLTKLGFKETDKTCCEAALGLCTPLLPPCENRNEYVYWDGIHPTEAINKLVGERIYQARDPTDATPYDLKGLVALYSEI